MPIYEYECRECGYRLDALQKISDPLLTDCPECAQPSLKKLLSAPHFRLKGSGWYETDFKHSGRPKPEKGAEGGEGGDSKQSSDDRKDSGKSAAPSSGSDGAPKSSTSGATADPG